MIDYTSNNNYNNVINRIYMMRGDFMLLMCKNTPVYDIDNEKILNTNLLPGLMEQKGANNHTFTKWMKYRYSSGTNTIAPKLKGITFGQGSRIALTAKPEL